MNPSPPFFFDLKRLFDFRSGLQSLDPDGPPSAISFGACGMASHGRVGILSGAFNPPTEAHRELAASAASSFQLDRVFLTVARVTVDKESAGGLCAEDRLLLLSELAAKLGRVSVAAVNRGLYFEQVEAFRRLLGRRARLFVVCGMDKVLQIFDGRYYQDRDSALKRLFTGAQLIAAGRSPWAEADLDRLLSLPENAPYRDRIYFMAMDKRWGDLSSTRIRAAILDARVLPEALPAPVRDFVEATGCYRPPVENGGEEIDRYAHRTALLDLLYRGRAWTGAQVDFAALLEAASSSGSAGRELRALVRSTEGMESPMALERLARFIRARRGR